MIKIKDKEINLKQDKAEKTEAYKKNDTEFNPDIMKFKVKEMSGKNWRLIHDGTKVMALIEGKETDFTTTIHEVLEFPTEEAALKEIDSLGLEYEAQEAS